LAVVSRFVLDLRVGPRTLETAVELMVSIALASARDVLILMDEHRPYPRAILQVFGILKYRRRKRPSGQKLRPVLKPPPGLLVGVVQKWRNAQGRLLRVTTRALFGRRPDIRRRLRKLRIGRTIHTAHLERLNGTLRNQQARLTRRTRNGSRKVSFLIASLRLWRDVYNWTRVHAALAGRTPAMALGLAAAVWSIRRYIRYPVHVGDLQRQAWDEQRNEARRSPLDAYIRKRSLPIS
jgi:hypothetical protein